MNLTLDSYQVLQGFGDMGFGSPLSDALHQNLVNYNVQVKALTIAHNARLKQIALNAANAAKSIDVQYKASVVQLKQWYNAQIHAATTTTAKNQVKQQYNSVAANLANIRRQNLTSIASQRVQALRDENAAFKLAVDQAKQYRLSADAQARAGGAAPATSSTSTTPILPGPSPVISVGPAPGPSPIIDPSYPSPSLPTYVTPITTAPSSPSSTVISPGPAPIINPSYDPGLQPAVSNNLPAPSQAQYPVSTPGTPQSSVYTDGSALQPMAPAVASTAAPAGLSAGFIEEILGLIAKLLEMLIGPVTPAAPATVVTAPSSATMIATPPGGPVQTSPDVAQAYQQSQGSAFNDPYGQASGVYGGFGAIVDLPYFGDAVTDQVAQLRETIAARRSALAMGYMDFRSLFAKQTGVLISTHEQWVTIRKQLLAAIKRDQARLQVLLRSHQVESFRSYAEQVPVQYAPVRRVVRSLTPIQAVNSLPTINSFGQWESLLGAVVSGVSSIGSAAVSASLAPRPPRPPATPVINQPALGSSSIGGSPLATAGGTNTLMIAGVAGAAVLAGVLLSRK